MEVPRRPRLQCGDRNRNSRKHSEIRVIISDVTCRAPWIARCGRGEAMATYPPDRRLRSSGRRDHGHSGMSFPTILLSLSIMEAVITSEIAAVGTAARSKAANSSMSPSPMDARRAWPKTSWPASLMETTPVARPVGLGIDGTGAVLIADDAKSTVWRVANVDRSTTSEPMSSDIVAETEEQTPARTVLQAPAAVSASEPAATPSAEDAPSPTEIAPAKSPGDRTEPDGN